MALFKKNQEKDQDAVEPAADVKSAKSAKTAPVAETENMKDLYAATPTQAKAAKGDKTARKVSAARIARANAIMVKPLVTEKVTDLNGLNKYVFAVTMEANKIEVAMAIEALYGVKPTKVNMIKLEGKAKTYGRRAGKRKDWKKAIVTLPKSKTIDVYEGV
ncbi:MAG: 50S ribosomal protein L23 [Candidatus Falkowbacteria bacterium]